MFLLCGLDLEQSLFLVMLIRLMTLFVEAMKYLNFCSQGPCVCTIVCFYVRVY